MRIQLAWHDVVVLCTGLYSGSRAMGDLAQPPEKWSEVEKDMTMEEGNLALIGGPLRFDIMKARCKSARTWCLIGTKKTWSPLWFCKLG